MITNLLVIKLPVFRSVHIKLQLAYEQCRI